MSNNTRLFLGGSLVLNAILIVSIIFIMINQPGDTNTANEPLVQIEPTVIEITQTPLIVTVVVSPTEPAQEPTIVATETAVPTLIPTETPTEEAQPTTEPSPTIVPTATPQPEPTEVVYTGPEWLQYTNRFRAQAGLPFLVENKQLSTGAANHSYYMVVNNVNSHNEDPSLTGYTDTGAQAGVNGNIAISGVAGTTYSWPIDYWISAAFHIIPLLDPALEYVGYGEHSDFSSNFGMVATMDVKSGLRAEAADVDYPIMFPHDGGETWVRSYGLPEFPNTAAGCSGYQKPTGAPIILLLGDGENTPRIRETRLEENGNIIPHCAFDETDYYNPDAYWQEIGREILDKNDTVVILPRSPLKVGQTYTVFVNNGGEAIEWSFQVVESPPLLTEEDTFE